jgi:hypothetical protein
VTRHLDRPGTGGKSVPLIPLPAAAGNGITLRMARANSSDPMPARTAIHYPLSPGPGAHQVEPVAGAPWGCLRWRRDSQRATAPSGRTRSA